MAHLFWGGADCVELAHSYGTPLYVLDESAIRARCAEICADFVGRWPRTSASYAAKAFLTTTMARIVDQEGLGLDVVSGGELYTALKAGFAPSRIEMNGNAKSEQELRLALSSGVGRIVVDGPMELELLEEIAGEMNRRADILLRVSPGVNPHTHAYITTGHHGSKFGFPIEGDLLLQSVDSALSARNLRFKGFHFHIGSQIFENEAYVESVIRIVRVMGEVKKSFGFDVEELNFGGGYGTRVHPDEPHVPLRFFTDAMMETLTKECEARGLSRPSVSIEPGRWIVSEAGIMLYSVETVKSLTETTYVGVNGGMPDNPRPSLYQAEYRAALAGRMDASATGTVTVTLAGKCCETGDILIESAKLPEVKRGDIVAVFNTGAYTFSMASNYNRLPRPAVVLVKDGRADLIVARQSYDDLLAGDNLPERLRG